MQQGKLSSRLSAAAAAALFLTLAGCGFFTSQESPAPGQEESAAPREVPPVAPKPRPERQEPAEKNLLSNLSTLFGGGIDPAAKVAVNKHLWNASFEVLEFLPVESADPYSGVIVTGWGSPPGSGRQFRAKVEIVDPALDARSLKLTLSTRSGPAGKDTVKAIEDAIFTRARQLHINSGGA